MNRRQIVQSVIAGAMGEAFLGPAAVAGARDFTFVHFTDTHIQPEKKAAAGCRDCFEAINRVKPDFALSGGDLVFDSNETTKKRAIDLFDLYGETVKRLHMPVHTVPGNHDVVGLSNKSGMEASDPLYGKRVFEDRIGKRYQSFDHKGWHFVLLDSIGITEDRGFVGKIDDEQLTWLKTDLEKAGRATPIVMLTHVPLVSAVLQIVPDPWKTAATYLVQNSGAVLEIMKGHNVKAVLQGHTHIRETVLYNGCQFITSGAVCGNWWKGPRVGHPEGFGVLMVRGGNLAWRYETYGFQAEGG
jgi:Icc protein